MDQWPATPAPSPDPARWWVAAPLAGIWLLLLTILSLRGHVPLTYDEAWNFTDIASRGVVYVISHYPNPNNHVAFTALQALLLPATLVETWPPLLRIPNLLVGAALLALLARVLGRSRGPATATLLALCVLLVSPLFTTYLLVARGYLLGTLLLLASLVWAAEGRSLGGTVLLLALATWTVPTFGYAVPGALAGAALCGRQPRRAAVAVAVAGLAYLALVLLLYAPVLPAMLAQRQSWRGAALPGRFSLGIVGRLANVPITGVGVLALLLAAGAALLARRRPDRSRDRLLLLALAASASFLVVAETLTALHLVGTPFWRNMLFAPLFLALALGLVLPALPRGGQVLVWALLLSNAALGVRDLGASFVTGSPADYRGLRALGPTGVERALRAEAPFWNVRCDRLAEAVCQAYAAHLPGLSFGPREADSLPCLAGGSPPPDGLGITVSAGGGRRQICY
ncbi:MAG TPA: hypothetical protein VN375_14985 [Vicinamibacteria bacterium]|nr:hypothetical protein [Vicinamibacteria bacterium]